MISSVGQIGSLIAPIAIGWLTTRTHQITSGLFLAAAVLACGAVVMVRLAPRVAVERAC